MTLALGAPETYWGYAAIGILGPVAVVGASRGLMTPPSDLRPLLRRLATTTYFLAWLTVGALIGFLIFRFTGLIVGIVSAALAYAGLVFVRWGIRPQAGRDSSVHRIE